jgi:hypothetical protein
MFVRLTRKLAEVVNGIDISAYAEGDVIELAPPDAQLLIAECWAEPIQDEGRPSRLSTCRPDTRAVAADRQSARKREEDDAEGCGDPTPHP